MKSLPSLRAACVLLCGGLLLNGCAWDWKNAFSNLPGVYKIDIRQGNIVDQQDIDQLKPGMNRQEVHALLGTPLILNVFHQNRWDYVYSFRPGRGEPVQRRLSLFFDGDILARLEGDLRPGAAPDAETP